MELTSGRRLSLGLLVAIVTFTLGLVIGLKSERNSLLQTNNGGVIVGSAAYCRSNLNAHSWNVSRIDIQLRTTGLHPRIVQMRSIYSEDKCQVPFLEEPADH